MQSDAQSLREDLYKVIEYYADIADLAKKGEVDPIGQIGKIVKQTIPYLLLLIRDILPKLEKDELDYYEALWFFMLQARNFSDIPLLIDSKNEIQRIEEKGKVFLYGCKWLDAQINHPPSKNDIDIVVRKLRDLNEKYRARYLEADSDTATLIPCYFQRQEESVEQSISRVADLVRRALLELHHLMIENEPEKRMYFFDSPSRKEIEEDIMGLAWFLFRCGHTVDRIASGYYKDHISDFLNEKLLDHLAANQKKLDSLQGISTHLMIICYLDFLSFYELASDYAPLSEPKEVTQKIKLIKQRNRKGWNLLQRLSDLYKAYGSKSEGKLVQNFLAFRYHYAFGDYRGDHRITDPRGTQALKIYQPLLDRNSMAKKAEEDLQKSSKGFSSKTMDQMSDLLKLILDSLADPGKVKGRKVKILGDISSGAMGKVCIGIFRNQIVAIKKVKSDVAPTLGDPIALLKYEAGLHARVQTPEQCPYIVEYHGIIEQDGDFLLLNGYHPNDNLTQLVERNWQEKYKPPFSVTSKISLATFELVVNQLLECLRVFRSKGVVHRDLKTDNILYMVDENEILNRIKVIDFGVALGAGPGALDDIFKGKIVGTFAYMAPEQARGRAGFQSDLYSVGAIFTVLLTGQLPMTFPKTRTRQELVQQILKIETKRRRKLTELNPWLKRNTFFEQIAATVDLMLELDPLRRPTIEEIQAQFDGIFQNMGEEKHALSIYYHKI